jgi:hypothetical protein
MDFGGFFDAGQEHSKVVNTFKRLIDPASYSSGNGS